MATKTDRCITYETHMTEVAEILAAGIIRRRKREMNRTAADQQSNHTLGGKN